MKKLFFFKSSGNRTDKHLRREKESDSNSNGGQALTKSRSLSSTAFLNEATSSNDPRSNQNRQRNQSSRFRCKTTESSHLHKVHDSTGSFSTCSSNLSSQILDRYIEGEENTELSKENIGSSHSNLPWSLKGKKLQNRQTNGTRRNLSSTDHIQSCLIDSSPQSVARTVIERLSNTPEATNLPLTKHYEHYRDDNTELQELFSHGKESGELEKKYKEAEKRVKLLSKMEQKFLSDNDIRQMEEEKIGLAFEVLSLLQLQIHERAEHNRAKTSWDLEINRLEKEKSEFQFRLEKEFERRLSEWTSKLERTQMEEKRLRERVRELAEHNVSLQRELSSFHENETKRIEMIKHLDETVTELSETAEELREKNVHLLQNISRLEQNYTETRTDLCSVRTSFEEKDKECMELHKSVTKFVRICKEQEKTIQGLRDCFSGKKLQMEQIRLTGIEFSLRKKVESMEFEGESLRRENLCLKNRVKGNGEEGFKLDDEIKMRVRHLQEEGLSMLDESSQLCYKFLKFFKEKSMDNGWSEQFLIESEMNVNGIRRGSESLKRSLQKVDSLLLEKSNEIGLDLESSSSCELNKQSVEKSLKAELREETLLTSLLREKLYSKEKEIEQLQAEVATGVRCNEVLQCQIQNILDKLSLNTHQLKDLKSQMLKKDENINWLETNLQEATKDLASMKVTLPEVLEEREMVWREVRECRERNMDLETEKEMLKKKTEKLEEDIYLKEGQITILKDSVGNKHFDILSSSEFLDNGFLVQ